jgi:hypothetical protein
LNWKSLIHGVGLSCVGSGIFLQILAFASISTQGYFYAVETNSIVLALEFVLVIASIFYFTYLVFKLLKNV